MLKLLEDYLFNINNDLWYSIWIILLLLLHGIREGFTWANSLARKTNKIIKHKKGFGFIDYHAIRILEYLCLVMIIHDIKYILLGISAYPLYEWLEIYITRPHLSFKEIIMFKKVTWSLYGEGYRPSNMLIYPFSLICLILYLYIIL